ncbi:LapA family protein [Pseudoalteromonas fenneropenaei]|uniref:LapA family protein n=1 Tax=Pseudoalteromonas fenneropenaei TaxID=1737459 RepID=A0ABV7CP73_9GAMM
MVDLNFIVASSTLPLATVMSLCLVLGIIIGLSVMSVFTTKLKWQHYRLQKQHQKAGDVDN